MRKLTLIILTILFSSILYAQNGKLVGVVKDKQTNEPLIGANVIINGTNYGRLDLEVGGTLKGSVWADSGGLGLDAGGNGIEFYAGSAERLRITSAGKVSLGYPMASPTSWLHVKGNTYQTLRLENFDGGANGPYIELYNNSASPADDDYTGIISFKNRNSAAEEITYAQIRSQSTDVTDGTEDGALTLVGGDVSINDLIEALNQLGVKPRDLGQILQAIKASGAMQAELEVI